MIVTTDSPSFVGNLETLKPLFRRLFIPIKMVNIVAVLRKP